MNHRSRIVLACCVFGTFIAAGAGGALLVAAESTAPVPGLVSSVAAAAAPLEVRLRLETNAPGRFVRLRDVVEVRSDRDGVFEAVGDTVVRVRDGRFVRRVDVVRRLLRAGLAEGSFRVTGPALCDWRPRSGAVAGAEEGQ
jgi:hypothetical protein